MSKKTIKPIETSEIRLNRLQAYAKEKPIFSFKYLDMRFLRNFRDNRKGKLILLN